MADKIYYDVVATGTSNTTHSFFTHTEKSDGITTTNLTESNKLDKDFTLKRIILMPAGDIAAADAIKLTEKAVIEIKIDNQRVIVIPAFECLASAGMEFYPDAGSTGTSTYTKLSDILGGYQFEEPIRIPANVKFEVDLHCASAFSADTNLTIELVGSSE